MIEDFNLDSKTECDQLTKLKQTNV